MDTLLHFFVIYVLPLIFIWGVYRAITLKKENKSRSLLAEQKEAGLGAAPTSLHPVIDLSKCIGCSACADACPEQNVLGVINGKVELVTPSNCIGHGACRVACPVDAITLVFGTEQRGVDIPLVKPNFETDVPGVFIAGELGGMGLIRNAVTQGRQALNFINEKISKRTKINGVYDIVIIGAGPAGFSAALGAIEKKLNYIVLEQETFGGTVAHYPRGKIVMTQPMIFPLLGETHFDEISKEQLMNFWQDAAKKHDLKINYSECVEKVTVNGDLITVKSALNTYKTQAVLLAIGRRGTPRKLGVPGENKTKVVYHLLDPQQYQGKHVLVVGGGDSALEAAISISNFPKTVVTLSYRSDAFSRVKPKNQEQINLAQNQKRINIFLNSNILEINDNDVVIDQKGQKFNIKNDTVIICAGGILPTAFLKEIGVRVETKFGTA